MINPQSSIAGLNDQQKEAVTLPLTSSGLVVAGAGSGKTKVLTQRINYLLGKSVMATSIMSVTFTNKAAREMKERLAKMSIDVRGLTMGTFHSIGYQIMRQNLDELGWPTNVQILDSREQLSWFKKMLRRHGVDPAEYQVEDHMDRINNFKDSGLRAGDVLHNRQINDFPKRVKEFYAWYEEETRAEGILDFAELMLGSYELLTKHPNLAKRYQERYRFVLVDEFQDANKLQYAWLQSLTSVHKNIFVVGDFDQSIYGFRGAHPQNLFKIVNDFPHMETVKLEQNYRSEKYVLDAANAVISNNKARQPKTLWTNQATSNKIRYKSADNDTEEAAFVADTIQGWNREGIDYKDMAILYRTNSLSRNFEKILMARNIPFTIYGGLRFFERQEVKHALAYLRLTLNRKDNLSLGRIINIPARGIGTTIVENIAKIAEDESISWWEASHKVKPAQLKKLTPFHDFIDGLEQHTAHLDLAGKLEYIIKFSGLIAMYENKNEDERVENLYETIAAARVFLEENPNSDVEDFMALAQLDGDFEKNNRDKTKPTNTVQMMTLHASKGLEFPIVFLVGLNDGIFPHERCMDNEEQIEEERRLMYVGITRAKRHLYFTQSSVRYVYGQQTIANPSRFIQEIPKELIQRIY